MEKFLLEIDYTKYVYPNISAAEELYISYNVHLLDQKCVSTAVRISFTEETGLLRHIFTKLPHVRLQRAVTQTAFHIFPDRCLEFST